MTFNIEGVTNVYVVVVVVHDKRRLLLIENNQMKRSGPSPHYHKNVVSMPDNNNGQDNIVSTEYYLFTPYFTLHSPRSLFSGQRTTVWLASEI